MGNGGTLTFNNVNVATGGTYRVTLVYCSGDPRPTKISAGWLAWLTGPHGLGRFSRKQNA